MLQRVLLACIGLALSSPGGGEPPPAITPEARALHERMVTLDTHFDTAASLRRPGWDILQAHTWTEDLTQVDYPRLVAGGIDGGFWAIYTAQGPRTPEGHAAARDEALQILWRLNRLTVEHSNHFGLAVTAADAARLKAAGKRIVYLSMENGYPIGRDISLLTTFHRFGLRMFAPVHFANNELADSATDPTGPEWGGLSPLGRQAVAECNRLGIVLDASHAADAVVSELLELSATPLVLSHSGCSAVYDHPRNVPDELLRRVAAKGGVISMNIFSDYLAPMPVLPERTAALRELIARYGGRSGLTDPAAYESFIEERRQLEQAFPMPLASFDAFMAHLLHALEVVGPDHVGISGDFDGGGGAEGLMDVADLPRITTALLAAGYDEDDLAKIWGDNVLRVLRAAEVHAQRGAK